MGLYGFFQTEDHKRYYSSIQDTKDEYYRKFVDLISVEDILNVSNIDEANSILSEKEIRIFGLSFKDDSARLLKAMGKPRYRITDQILDFDHLVFFYKKDFFRHRALIQFHFLNDTFVYCHISFEGLPEKHQKKLSVMLDEKYNDGKGNSLFRIITDCQGNFVWIERSVYPAIIYRNNSSGIRKIALQRIDEQKLLSLSGRQKHYEEWRSNL